MSLELFKKCALILSNCYKSIKTAIHPFMYKIFLLLVLSCCCKFLFSQDTISSIERFKASKLIVPSSLMVVGTLVNIDNGSLKYWLNDWRNENLPDFRTAVDDYLQYSPIVIAYGLDAFGVKSKTDIINRSLILAKGELMVLATTQLMKNTITATRPDGSATNSFPSGHTTQAFAAATFLSEEYKDELPWMPYFAYSIATSVGALRIANNRHYLSDVLFGAGLGILCMKASYWLHRYTYKPKKVAVASMYF